METVSDNDAVLKTQVLDSRHFLSRFLCLGFGADIGFDRYIVNA